VDLNQVYKAPAIPKLSRRNIKSALITGAVKPQIALNKTKFSFVNETFVKDFYEIIKEDYIERFNEFLIDSEVLRKWLQINNRQMFIKTIKKSIEPRLARSKVMQYIIIFPK
jgi:hypothetical protein